MAIVLSKAAVLTVDANNRFLPAADIRIEGRTIEAIGAPDSLARPGDIIVDCSEALVTPGLINVHTHAATAFFRSLADDRPREFWSAGYAVPGQERFTVAHHVSSVRAACAEFLLNGVTCIADRLGDMDHIAPVIEQTGIRAIVGHTLLDSRGPADWKTADAVLERFGTDPAKRVSAGIAPHALDSCSDALLREVARRADKTGARVFIHVAQSEPGCAVQTQPYRGAQLSRATASPPFTVAARDLSERCGVRGLAATHRSHCPANNLKIRHAPCRSPVDRPRADRAWHRLDGDQQQHGSAGRGAACSPGRQDARG
jgi:5-methylthioadenosine/S-adenosylhomocysteine deaminase